jgi:hypothetical protein
MKKLMILFSALALVASVAIASPNHNGDKDKKCCKKGDKTECPKDEKECKKEDNKSCSKKSDKKCCSKKEAPKEEDKK